jgi:hypothetical protein
MTYFNISSCPMYFENRELTTIPSRTFSPPSLSSTASSSTMFKKTYHLPLAKSSHKLWQEDTHIITSQHANNLPTSIQLHKEPFVEVLQYHLSPFVLFLLLTFAVFQICLSRASKTANFGLVIGMEWSPTYLL